MNHTKTIGLLFLLSCFLSSAAQEEEVVKPKTTELHGYIKNLQTASFTNRPGSLSSLNLLHNRVNMKFNLSKKISGRLEIRNRLFYGDQLKQFPDFGTTINQYNGLFSLSKLWVNKETLVVHSVIDRMLLQYTSGKWDIRAGRQRINWGINNVWNPNDIFNAYNFLDFDYEERPGNDAIRIQRFFRNNASAELAWKPGQHSGESIAALLYKFNTNNYDIQLLAGLFETDLVAGGGWAGHIKQAGFKGELSYFHPKNKRTGRSGTVSFSLMADQTFKQDWYVSLSALYNSHPAPSSGSQGHLFGSSFTARQLFPFKYSFYTGVMKSFSPVTSMNISVIYSPEKNSLILFPSFAWNVSKDADLDFTAQSFFARSNSRYQTEGTSLFLRLKWSF